MLAFQQYFYIIFNHVSKLYQTLTLQRYKTFPNHTSILYVMKRILT